MTRTITLLILLLAFSIPAAAQIDIYPMRVIYNRYGEDVPDFKKTFEVRYPIVAGVNNARVRRSLESALDYENVFDVSIQESREDYHWLYSLDYKVHYNKGRVLCIEMIMEGAGAYPSTYTKTIVVDARTGRKVAPAQAFTNVRALTALVREKQTEDEEKKIREMSEESEEDGEFLREALRERNYTINKLDEYQVNEEGVTFLYDYGFPHAVLAMQPDGRYFFSWEEISPYVRRNGVLREFLGG